MSSPRQASSNSSVPAVVLAAMFGAVVFVAGCATDAGSTTQDGGESVAFSSGGFTLTARTIQTGGVSSTTITDAGETVVEMDLTVDTVTLGFPTQGADLTTISFNIPLDALPSEFATNRLATFVAGQLFGVGGGLRADNPGCDMFPDTRCTLRCCADHDRCYADNGCSFLSWLANALLPAPLANLSACANCNAVAARCIVVACATGSEGDPDADVCFDSACGASYTCPAPDEFDCFACPSPCTDTPSSCGNGSCELGETAENCVSDCSTGLGVNTCCRSNGNCPSETATTCPGDCCCCGFGEVCGAGEVCVLSGSPKVRRSPEPLDPAAIIEAKRRAADPRDGDR